MESVQIEKSRITIEKLLELIDPKNPALLEELGGPKGLAEKLHSSIERGLSNNEQILEEQKRIYGDNKLPEPISHTLLEFVWEALKDKTLMVLMVAAAIEVVIGIVEMVGPSKDTLALIDGAAIIGAILIVVTLAAGSDWRKQAQFRSLNEFGKGFKTVKVWREGLVLEIQYDAIIVGDIIEVQTGLVVPADGILFAGFSVEADESTMTGEPQAVRKALDKDPFLISGTSIVNGVGKMLVIATGVNSMNGRSLMALEVEAEDTPLQIKLGRVADFIAKGAFILALTLIVVLLIIYFVVNGFRGGDPNNTILKDLLALLILAVTIVVVAVPEGLPLAVTISLAHATLAMLKDNNLVRHLAACETMGNATTICSDKTGTLTLNKMTVVNAMFLDENYDGKEPKEIVERITSASPSASRVLALAAKSLNVNSTACEITDKDGKLFMQGSKTEIAILDFFTKMGYPYEKDRQETEMLNIVPFSSAAKRMSCKIAEPADQALFEALGIDSPEKTSDGKFPFIFVKGASEIVLKTCNRIMTNTGKIIPLTDEKKSEYEKCIVKYADEALRTICCGMKPVYSASDESADLNETRDLVLVGIFGILDPLRPEVPGAVASCKEAGIIVRMVTGDSTATAKAIARGCGILDHDGIVMEGPDFRKLSESELDKILPKLQVLARSSPLDKQILVRNLKRLGETVAVTGDGTNDAPALSSADVGFSMGIAGTEVAKEASDIILLDDNFASLVKAVIWGRCVYDAIRKFLQFQLTVNISAVVIASVTAIYTTVTGPKRPESALTAVQLLWVNLIMDTLAALALATDKPSLTLLQRKPSKKDESIITSEMLLQIVGQAVYQIIVCLVIYFCGPTWWPFESERIKDKHEPAVGYVTETILFNTFIFCQVFNEINARSLTRKVLNVFKDIHKNHTFLMVLLMTFVLQIIIVQFGSVVFTVDKNGLNVWNWLICIALGSGSLIVGLLIRLCIPDIPINSAYLGGNVSSTVSKSNLGDFEGVVIEARDPPKNVIPVATFGSYNKGSPRNSTSKKIERKSDQGLSRWSQVRHHVLVTKSFRRGRLDLSKTQMVTARAIKGAQQNQAKSHQNLH